ncbi:MULTISPECIES: LysR family transcriptional regulator [Streptomyces]|uniref:LysR family transcriptional regulator n=1 Tax=Streptomyces glycanivorans TaxID=3033808 RepID=A0ABY9JL48_9ACTN|nr:MULTISPECIES: LysR family transcriptional regulator [unclassified Streptomyces]WSQ81707.1 LysR family transcriptional regulator [Streptomyces sp. NBC_01213]TXS13026.1 LysR family transcriptional regulator [Streptomyces sp. wa22]WLQ68348.1 LysR family transcriptional regulator [Streptomyces sp. Alt3]WSQ89033.1 LysR family transcriptional regulator [Streptomyces sp. NBC_01212]WSR04962.1 LysR family transcriptional regulator [Streptomyces sp. NBC_01208]
MERHEIEAFLALAEELHFGRTAERLGVSQGRVSQTIKGVERRIGGPLFDRTSRRVALTPLGRQLRTDLEPHHRGIQEAISRATETARGLTGRLSVGYTAAWNGSLLLDAVDLLRTRHPECTVEILEDSYGATLRSLRTGRVDLHVAELPVEEPDIIVGPTVCTAARALAVPADHPLATRDTVGLEDLALAPLIRPAGMSQVFLDAHFPQHTPGGRPVPRGPVAASWQDFLTLVGSGKGVTPTCVLAAAFYARQDIVYVPFRDAPPIRYALLRSTRTAGAKVHAFTRVVTELAAAG